MKDETPILNQEDIAGGDKEDQSLLRLAKEVYSSSTDYLDSNIRKRIEKNVAHFHNRHAKDSKFRSMTYKNRNKLFHPKTRNSARSNEAAFAAAMFSTADLVSVTAVNQNDPYQQLSAQIHQGLLNHRLEKSIQWFLTSVGAFQDAYVNGICASYNYWEYEERQYGVEVPLTDDIGNTFLDPETGEQLTVIQTETEVVKDKPCVDLIPLENLRFDPGADWRDPINTSPYVIRDVPMYATDIQARMASEDQKTGRQPWRKYSLDELLSASSDKEDDSTRSAREGEHLQDPTETNDHNEFSVIWLREYFIRRNGEDVVFWTVGDHLLLSDPAPLDEVYLHGQRPITVGICVLEAHKTYPSSPVELNAQLQERANGIVNQRADNVDLVLNKRYYLKRGSKIDTAALMRNTPGGGVMMDDPDKDIRTESTPDVTSSSYAEQDRLDVLMDETAGAFSQSSVQNNRMLNETVGGMELMNGSASAISEYTIRTFVETWVEPTLRQLVKLEAMYETDETIIAIAAEEAKDFQRYGQNQTLDSLLDAELTVRVNVGIGATNPQQKVDRMRTGFATVGQIAPHAIPRIKEAEVIKEVFGVLGYKDGARFFNPEEEMQTQEPQADPMLQIKLRELELKDAAMQFDQQLELQKIQDGRERWMAEMALNQEMTVEQLLQKTGLEREKIKAMRDIASIKGINEQARLQLQAENLAQQHDTF